MLAVFALPALAQVYAPSQMPNVQIERRDQYVSDPANLLPADVKDRINRSLYNLRKNTSVEAVVAIPPEIGDLTPAEWCEQLFTEWGIGKSDKDNGLLIMISPGSRCAFIMPGYGVEGVLTDIACKKIVTRDIVPAMKAGDLAAAVENSTRTVIGALENPEVAAELRSDEADNYNSVEPLDSAVIMKFIGWVAGFLFLGSMFLYIYVCVGSRRRSSNYAKAEMWRSQLAPFVWLGVFSLGSGLIFLLLAYLTYRYWRTRRVRCSTCGAKMNRLPEDKDNELLSDSQDFEEKLRTVDYDVWECPKCGTIERFPFKADQKKYTECPSCHTIAMCLQCDMTVRPATTRAEGNGVKIYECQYCHHQQKKPYRIPRKEDPSAAIAAGAILGSTMGRGGGFGGSGGFGGGFGGGSTGGGGAGGSW